MRRTTLVLPFVCLLVPIGARAADSTRIPDNICNAAAKTLPPPWDRKAIADTCRRQEAERKAAMGLSGPAAVSVRDSKVKYDAFDYSAAPWWPDDQIKSQFAALRDQQYLTDTHNSDPSPRRISWLYPNDGCFSRAEEFDKEAQKAGRTRPYKLWAFGGDCWITADLRVYTDNDPDGVVHWCYHVVPAVRNDANELIVFDPAINPCRPMPYQEWLLTMQDSLAFFDPAVNPDYGVAISDSNAYWPSDPVTGGPDLTTDPTSTNDQQDTYLNDEWIRQEYQLPGRDAHLVLGDYPPWIGSACTFTSVSHSPPIDIAAGASASAIATCPFATLSVGGGLMSSHPSLLISKNARLDNGWEIAATNTSTETREIIGSAVCLTGAPQTASVSTVTGPTVNIPRYWLNSTTATCSSGILVGGGYSTTVSGSPASIMRIFSDGRTSDGNSWRVSAFNNADSGRSVTSYAYCLNNTSFSASQTSGTLSPEGIATASCPAPLVTMGGGFTFPWTSAYYVATMDNQGSVYAVDMLPPPVNPDPNAKAYAQCLSVPASPSSCTEATATDMGAEHAVSSVPGNGCLKITQYPGSWVGGVILQAQGGGSGYPIPYTWTNCTNGDSGSITGNWTQYTLRPASHNCTTLIDLNGSDTASVMLTWWANG
jgi:hypothetical protein